MSYFTGRLIDHLHMRTSDLEGARRFYVAVLAVLDIPLNDGGEWLEADELFIDAGTPASHVHLAFQAASREVVDQFHAAALAAGGADNGRPGPRPYHGGYYAAFVLDPDGNNIEAVFHGPTTRSALAVEIERLR